jgi:hypothetical protein
MNTSIFVASQDHHRPNPSYRLIICVLAAAVIFLGGMSLLLHQSVQTVELRPWPYEMIFSNSDLSPCAVACLLGVVPGMNFAESMKLLFQHPFMHNPQVFSPMAGVISLQTDNGLVVTLAPTPALTVIYVQLEWSRNQENGAVHQFPQLGDILLSMGNPDAVTIKHVGCFGYTLLSYDDLQVVTDFSVSLRPTTPVRSIYLSTLPTIDGDERKPWGGFSYTWRYGAMRGC